MSNVQQLHTEWVQIPDAPSMEAYLARPAGEGAWPAVLVFMEVFGVNSHIREVTERIAAEGYVALAINYYHRTTPNLELGYTEADMILGVEHKNKTTREGIFADVKAAIGFLKQQPTVTGDAMGSIGFCFGGLVAYLAATLPEIKATASFYGGGIVNVPPGGGAPTVSVTPDIHGRILCLFGEKDPLIPMSDTVEIQKALEAAGVDHEVVRYSDTGHGFFCNQRGDYSPHNAQDAWQRVKRLFAEGLK